MAGLAVLVTKDYKVYLVNVALDHEAFEVIQELKNEQAIAYLQEYHLQGRVIHER